MLSNTKKCMTLDFASLDVLHKVDMGSRKKNLSELEYHSFPSPEKEIKTALDDPKTQVGLSSRTDIQFTENVNTVSKRRKCIKHVRSSWRTPLLHAVTLYVFITIILNKKKHGKHQS